MIRMSKPQLEEMTKAATVYGVATKAFNQTVKPNMERFPTAA
jgi:hypothetical protein